MKVLILVMSADFEPFSSLTKAIKETWASYTLPEIDIYFYYGKSEQKSTEKDIFFDIDEGYYSLGYKTLEIFNYIKDLEFDYIFRTNSSSFVNQKKLLEFLSDKPRTNFYCGIVPFQGFASGCGYFLSKDLIELILKNKNSWNHQLLDDVALGQLLWHLKVPIDPRATRLDIYNDMGTSIVFSTINVENYYHFRCKYPQEKPFVPDKNRNHDIFAMKKLHEILKIN